MLEFRSGKTTLGIQLAGFAIGKNCLRRRLWLHAADLRLPLINPQGAGSNTWEDRAGSA